MTTLSLRALNRALLARQLLLRRERLDARTAIERVAGLQSQVPKAPFVGLWSRLEEFERGELLALMAKREVVRGTMMRGTIHSVSRRDFLAWRPLIQSALTRGAESITKKGGPLDVDALVAAGRKYFDEAPTPFDGLRERLESLFPGGDARQMAYSIRMNLALLMVPDDSPWGHPANSAFAVAETFLGKPFAKSSKPRDLVLRYLAAFGPATPADFQTWSGLTGARPLFDELGAKLETFRDERGRELFDLPDAPRPDEETEAPVRFLPEFDNVLMGHADRTRVIDDVARARMATNNLRVPAAFLVDGFAAGMWSITRKKKLATLTLEPFAKLSAGARKALTAEGERVVGFLEDDASLPVELRIEN